MDISIGQALLIGIVTAIALAGQLWGIYTNRSIVLSFFVGLILGDLPTALAMGAISELAFMGFGVGPGGTVPPNHLGPGIVGTIMAITLKSSGMTIESALALSFPFAVLVQFGITFVYSLFSGSPEWAKRALEQGKYKKFSFFSHGTVYGFLILGFLVGFISAVSMNSLEGFVAAIPQWLIDGLTVAGGLLPAIGFAMILNVMLKKEYIAYIFLGYISVAYLELPVMGVALVGAIFAIIEYTRNGDNKAQMQEEVFEDGI